MPLLNGSLKIACGLFQQQNIKEIEHFRLMQIWFLGGKHSSTIINRIMVGFGLFCGHFECIANSKSELTGKLCFTGPISKICYNSIHNYELHSLFNFHPHIKLTSSIVPISKQWHKNQPNLYLLQLIWNKEYKWMFDSN